MKKQSHFHKGEPFLMYSENTHLKAKSSEFQRRISKTQKFKERKKKFSQWCREDQNIRMYCCRDSIINLYKHKYKKVYDNKQKINPIRIQLSKMKIFYQKNKNKNSRNMVFTLKFRKNRKQGSKKGIQTLKPYIKAFYFNKHKFL